MGKHGALKGNSGLIYDEKGKLIMHIAAPYDNNGMVFVELEMEDGLGLSWERMSKKQADKDGRHIIPCCQCSKPATSIDHYFPYYIGQNLCDEHDYDYRADE